MRSIIVARKIPEFFLLDYHFITLEVLRRYSKVPLIRGGFFLVSRIFARYIHEISDLKKALVLSLRAEYTRLKESQKRTDTRGTLGSV